MGQSYLLTEMAILRSKWMMSKKRSKDLQRSLMLSRRRIKMKVRSGVGVDLIRKKRKKRRTMAAALASRVARVARVAVVRVAPVIAAVKRKRRRKRKSKKRSRCSESPLWSSWQMPGGRKQNTRKNLVRIETWEQRPQWLS